MYLQWYIRLRTAIFRQMNNLKFIILSYLGVKKSGIWTDAEISELVHKQSVTLFGG